MEGMVVVEKKYPIDLKEELRRIVKKYFKPRDLEVSIRESSPVGYYFYARFKEEIGGKMVRVTIDILSNSVVDVNDLVKEKARIFKKIKKILEKEDFNDAEIEFSNFFITMDIEEISVEASRKLISLVWDKVQRLYFWG